MGKYEKVSEKINELDELYLKAKAYDKIIGFGKAPLRCSFCGRPQNKIIKLIMAENNICICEHCVAICDNICQKEINNYEEIKQDIK